MHIRTSDHFPLIDVHVILAALDDDDDVPMINFNPGIFADDQNRESRIGRRQRSTRNGERRQQQNSSAILREAASLGAALGRAAHSRTHQGHARRNRNRRQTRQSVENRSPEDEPVNIENEEAVVPPNNELLTDQPENGQSNDASENSNSSWEDVSEEEVVIEDVDDVSND